MTRGFPSTSNSVQVGDSSSIVEPLRVVRLRARLRNLRPRPSQRTSTACRRARELFWRPPAPRGRAGRSAARVEPTREGDPARGEALQTDPHVRVGQGRGRCTGGVVDVPARLLPGVEEHFLPGLVRMHCRDDAVQRVVEADVATPRSTARLEPCVAVKSGSKRRHGNPLLFRQVHGLRRKRGDTVVPFRRSRAGSARTWSANCRPNRRVGEGHLDPRRRPRQRRASPTWVSRTVSRRLPAVEYGQPPRATKAARRTRPACSLSTGVATSLPTGASGIDGDRESRGRARTRHR